MPVLPNKEPGLDFYGYGRSVLAALLSLGILIALAARAPAPLGRPMSVQQLVMTILSLALLAVFLAIFLLSPRTFSDMSLEDGAIEWASALLPIAGSVLVLWCGASLVIGARGRRRAPWAGLALIVCAALLFTLGMEEISWMQRVFGLATPQGLSGNIQRELNLHNLATNQIGTLHKIAGFVFLIFLPFIHATAPRGTMVSSLSVLIPSRCVALVSAPLAALNYNGWDFLAMQMTTYLTLGIVLYFAFWAWREERYLEMTLCAVLAILIIVAQLAFIALGDNFTRIWDITEYKELYIALGLFVWAMETFNRLRPRTVPARA